MKIQERYLQTLLPFILMAASLSQPIQPPYISNITKSANIDKLKQRRSTPLACNINQYFDKEEGRCLGVPGGGRAIDVDNTKTCSESNTLSVHCTNPRYYHICKEDKIILAECANGTHFDTRLQRCVYVDPINFDSTLIRPEDIPYRKHINLPECARPGRFPLANDCALFYVCETNGHRLHQSAFQCPTGTGFNAEENVCSTVPHCTNEKDVSRTSCLVNAKNEHVRLESAPKTDVESDKYGNPTAALLHVDPTVKMLTSPRHNFEEWTTASMTSPEHNFERSTESTIQYYPSITSDKSTSHYGGLQDKQENEGIPRRHLVEASTTENYERLSRSTVMVKSSSTVNPVTENSKLVSTSTERDASGILAHTPGSSTTINHQISVSDDIRTTTHRIETMTIAPEQSSTVRPITLSPKATTMTDESKATVINTTEAPESTRTVELRETPLTSTTEGTSVTQDRVSTLAFSDEQPSVHSSTLRTTDESEIRSKPTKEQLSLTTPSEFHSRTTNSPITK